MKSLLSLVLIFSGFQAQASNANLYDQTIQDCTDYGHPPVSSQELAECKKLAKETVLSLEGATDQYLVCVDYGHMPISEEKEERCLREISSSNN